jgi:hypothetical protein
MQYKKCKDCDAFIEWVPYTDEELISKKKEELKRICNDLKLTVSGNCEKLRNKIKTHYITKMQ